MTAVIKAFDVLIAASLYLSLSKFSNVLIGLNCLKEIFYQNILRAYQTMDNLTCSLDIIIDNYIKLIS
jgi:hypothetical protein